MPEIKIKHVASFSSEDSVYKAENLLKAETYRKWKCATPGEKQATVILQFEKSSQIQSIDIGNENSAFVEILVGRSSDSNNDFEVLLASSSFMSPLESRNGTNANRVRMFSPDKLVQNIRAEKWDLVKIICTQPFNKNIQYGLSFIKFYCPADPKDESANDGKEELKIGAFKLKEDIDDDNDLMPVGKWFLKRNDPPPPISVTSPIAIRQASVTIEDNSVPLSGVTVPDNSSINNLNLKRKLEDNDKMSQFPSKKNQLTRTHVNREKVGYKTIDSGTEEKNLTDTKNQDTSISIKKTSETKLKVKKKDFHQVMEKVVFVLSGYQNPKRSIIRDKALEMGAKYKGDWDSSCTHLICAFINTPKYSVVMQKGGRIVTEKWIFDCHKKKELLPWRNYMLGQYTISSTDDEADDSEVESAASPKKINGTCSTPLSHVVPSTLIQEQDKNATKENEDEHKKNLKNLNQDDTKMKGSTNEDETDAESDYKADTDVEDCSGGDTEDEIRRVEFNNKRKAQNSEEKPTSMKTTVSEGNHKKIPNPDDLPLPILPDFFKKKKFFLHGNFPGSEKHNLERYITAYNGYIEEFLNPSVKYVVTLSKWNEEFDEALADNEDLIFVRPQWIFNCHEKEKCVPYQPFIIIPES